MQVQVLTEQIEAQSDKISDLEKMLLEKKTMLSDAEEKLQRVRNQNFFKQKYMFESSVVKGGSTLRMKKVLKQYSSRKAISRKFYFFIGTRICEVFELLMLRGMFKNIDNNIVYIAYTRYDHQ